MTPRDLMDLRDSGRAIIHRIKIDGRPAEVWLIEDDEVAYVGVVIAGIECDLTEQLYDCAPVCALIHHKEIK